MKNRWNLKLKRMQRKLKSCTDEITRFLSNFFVSCDGNNGDDDYNDGN